MLLSLVAPDHPDGLTLLPLVPGVPALLVIELGLAVPGEGRVGPGQLLVTRLGGGPLVTGEVTTSRAGVRELVSIVHVVLVAAAEDETGAASLGSAGYPGHVWTVDTSLGHLHPQQPGLPDLDTGYGAKVSLELSIVR